MTSEVFTEPASQVLSSANILGFSVKPAALARWHREGLIPRPIQQTLKVGHGTVTLYPSGTSGQLVALCRVRRSSRSLDDVGFRLWLAGYPVSDRYSVGYLKTAADEYDQIVLRLKQARDRLVSDDESIFDNAADELATICDGRIPLKLARKFRKRVGKANFDVLGRLVIDIVTGQFLTFEDDTHDKIMRTVMGIRKVDGRLFGGALAWLANEISPTLADISAMLSGLTFVATIQSEDVDSLDLARSEFVELMTGLSYLSNTISKYLKIDLPGFRQISEIAEHARAVDLAWMLIAWCRMRRMPWASGYGLVLEALHGFSMLMQNYERI